MDIQLMISALANDEDEDDPAEDGGEVRCTGSAGFFYIVLTQEPFTSPETRDLEINVADKLS